MKLPMRIALLVALLWVPTLASEIDPRDRPDRPDRAAGMFAPDAEGQLMMTLATTIYNWKVSTDKEGFQGWDWPVSQPCEIGSSIIWSGVTCEGNQVTKIELAGLGLQGGLPPDLLLLSNLQLLNLSSNSFTGTLPPQWASTTLETLDLSRNLLNGPLPVAYGSKETFPKLSSIFLHENQFSGALPGPEWTSIGFAPQAVITLRPGNKGLCGPVPIVDPRFYTAMPTGGAPGIELLGPTAVSSESGITANTSQAYIVYTGLLGDTGEPTPYGVEGTSKVVVTNTLGSCADPCGRTAPLTSNILDAAWTNNVTLADLLAYNPGLTPLTAQPGTQLALPCYPPYLQPTHFGSNAAVGMFAGGNQRSMVGTIGAELAGVVVSPQGLNATTTFYEGIRDWKWTESSMMEVMVEPVYWFVQLDTRFTVSALSVTAGNGMEGISLYIGSDMNNVLGNTLVAQDLDFAPGETRIVSGEYANGEMVILYAGYMNEGRMSLANVKVWPSEGNAALRKPVFASSNPPDLNSTTDGSPVSCAYIKADSTQGVWFGVDLGYEFSVAVVVLTLEGGVQGTSAQVFVSADNSRDEVSNATVCGAMPTAPWGRRVGVQCDKQGRYVGVQVTGQDAVRVCEIEVFVFDGPSSAPAPSVSSSDVVGIAVGCAVGGAVLALAILGGIVYVRRRRRHLQVMAHASPRTGSFTDPETGLPIGSLRKGSLTSTSGGHSGGLLARKWFLALGRSDSDPGSPSSGKLGGAGEGIAASTDLSKFTDGCDIVPFSEIELVRTIGEGSYGLVWMARYLQTTVAVKVLTHDTKRGNGLDAGAQPPPPSAAVLNALQREASIMAALRHPNVAQYLGACLDPPALVMEYCSKRSVDRILAEALHEPKSAKLLDWVHLLSMATDAAKGMLYLHTRSPPIVHRDLKSPNLLVDALWHVKVSDFNLSRAMEQNSTVSSLQITNPRWLAPEVLKGGQAAVASDVYSFGIVLWELLTWELPWGHDANPFSIINKVVGGQELPVPSVNDLPAGPLLCYDAYVALMRRCWAPEACDRPSMDEVVQELRVMLSEMVQRRMGQGSQVALGDSSASSSEPEPSTPE